MYFYDKNGWDMKKNVDTLKKIAHALEKKSSLIAEIEYSVRKVLPEHTKKYLKNAIRYFEYCADCILLTKNIIIEDTSSCKDILYMNLYDFLFVLMNNNFTFTF